jgi:hypothetical protein
MRQTNPIWAGWPARGAGGRETPPGHDGAKQSQFWPEQREGQVPCRKGVMVHRTRNRLRQNKANSSIADWGPRSQPGVTTLRIEERKDRISRKDAKIAKGNRRIWLGFLCVPGVLARNKANSVAWPVAPNKPNFCHRADPEIGGPRGQLCDKASLPGVVPATKPIARSGAPRRCPAGPGGTRKFPWRCRRWRFWAKNPEYRFDSCVFWCSGILDWRP